MYLSRRHRGRREEAGEGGKAGRAGPCRHVQKGSLSISEPRSESRLLSASCVLRAVLSSARSFTPLGFDPLDAALSASHTFL